mgnify:FL=1
MQNEKRTFAEQLDAMGNDVSLLFKLLTAMKVVGICLFTAGIILIVMGFSVLNIEVGGTSLAMGTFLTIIGVFMVQINLNNRK